MTGRGYFGIGIVGGKSKSNVGTLWRSAAIMGAQFMFTAGARYPHQPGDTMKAWKHLPLFQLNDPQTLVELAPKDCRYIAVETGGEPITDFRHPERCIYLLGAEDLGLPEQVIGWCDAVLTLPGEYCMNVSVAGSLVMYDRLMKEATR